LLTAIITIVLCSAIVKEWAYQAKQPRRDGYRINTTIEQMEFGVEVIECFSRVIEATAAALSPKAGVDGRRLIEK
jgi:hypothetical protein